MILSTSPEPQRAPRAEHILGRTPIQERGPTYTEDHRHACEVAYVLAKRTSAERAEYLALVAARRSQEAVARLRADVATAWQAARRRPSSTPPPRDQQDARLYGGSVHRAVNDTTEGLPDDGSSLVMSPGGTQSRGISVVSEGPAR